MVQASERSVLVRTDNLPIRTGDPVHSGKVRSVYWLNAADSARLGERFGVTSGSAGLGIMVVSDRISAFDCLWSAEGGLAGVPGKGAALNAIAAHWFRGFSEAGLAGSHLVAVPHPLAWVVRRARPVRIEAIARRYLTGSLWRSYARGERVFGGRRLPDGLERNQRLESLLLTPSTKGVMRGLPGVIEADDAPVAPETVRAHAAVFGLDCAADLDRCDALLRAAFAQLEKELAKTGQILVDSKFEFGYVAGADGRSELIYMDEVGTPDSSRYWDREALRTGRVIERSKEGFRQALLDAVADPAILLDAARFAERKALAGELRLPRELFLGTGEVYRELAEAITGETLTVPDRPRESLIDTLATELGLLGP